MTDYTSQRLMMVDTQVRPSDVTKFPIIDAMLSTPRELFVPQTCETVAYAEHSLPLSDNRVILEPRTLAKMLDALFIKPSDVILDIGCGYGYSSAIAAKMAQSVVGVENNAQHAEHAERALAAAQINNVAIVHSELHDGHMKSGPYDVILVQGAVEQFPQSLSDQLIDGGRAACIFKTGKLGMVYIGQKIDGQIHWKSSFSADAPILTGFHKQDTFTL